MQKVPGLLKAFVKVGNVYVTYAEVVTVNELCLQHRRNKFNIRTVYVII